MKKFNGTGLRVLTGTILFAATSLASCSDNGEEPPTPIQPIPVELSNQIEYNAGTPIDIRSAIYEVEATDHYVFFLSPTSGIADVAGMTAANDYLRVGVSNPSGTVDPATGTYEIAYKDIVLTDQTGEQVEKLELSAVFTEASSQLELLLELQLKTGKTLRAHYKGVCNLTAPVKLDNQYELDKRISAIASAVEWHQPLNGVTSWCFYTQSGIAAPADGTSADLKIDLADGIETEEIDLATADPEEVTITCGAFHNTPQTTGTLRIVPNADGSELTLVLDAVNGESRLRAAYTGPVSIGYQSSDQIRIAEAGSQEETALTRVFRYKESIMNQFAFGMVDAETPAGLMEGHYAIVLGLSNLQIGSTIDLEKEASKCTLVLYDYRNYLTYDLSKSTGQGATGTITTAGTAERPYLYLSVVFPEGPAVESEWYGDVTPVQEAYELTPVKPFVPHMKIVSSDDEVLMEWNLSDMEVRLENNYRLRGGDPQYGGATFDAYFFYFRHEGSTEPIETSNEYPRLMIPASYLNSTDLNLAESQEELHWNFRFQNKNFQYTEYTEKYTMYGTTSGYCPDEVTTTVVRNADKTWKVSFRMKDYGSYSSWAPDRKEGTQNTVTIEWEGPATKYSGTNANALTDDDY